jgi:hypothetical protein
MASPSEGIPSNAATDEVIFSALARLPINRGLMIALGDVDGDADDHLILHPQEDANLNMFHPNIYVPKSILDDSDSLVRYGGGGELAAKVRERMNQHPRVVRSFVRSVGPSRCSAACHRNRMHRGKILPCNISSPAVLSPPTTHANIVTKVPA